MIERQIYFDLDLNEVAIILHMFLKKFAIGYRTINYHVEETIYYDINEEDTELKTIDKYTLIIIASKNPMTKKELIKVFDETIKNSISERSRI